MTKEDETPGLATAFFAIGGLALFGALSLFVTSLNDRVTDSVGKPAANQSSQYAALSIAISSLFFFGFGAIIARLHKMADHAARQTKLLASIANNTTAKAAEKESDLDEE